MESGNTDNKISLLVKVGIDTSSKKDLQTEVDLLATKLKGIDVKINIDPRAIAALEKISTMDFSKLVANSKKAGDDVVGMATKTGAEAKAAMEKAFNAMGKTIPKAIESGFSSAGAIKKAFEKDGINVKVGFDVKDGKRNMDKLVASYEKNGITTTVNFKQSTISDNGSNTPLWMPDKITEMDKTLSIAKKNAEQLTKEVMSLFNQGKLTTEQFKSMTAAIKGVGEKGGLDRANEQLNQMTMNNKKATEAIKAQEKAQKEQAAELARQEGIQKKILENETKRKNLIIDIERAMKSQTKSMDKTAGNNLIAQTRALDASSKNFGTSLNQNRSALKQLNADATTASRNNMGIINSFTTAMTKFPIWMAASTLFYGTVRTATEFASIIVDIDTKMTNLSKVMSEDTDFEGIFDRATSSAETFGQSISSALDAYTEFARQGFKGEDLGALSDAGLVASNVGEITAQKASEYMTASLIQWKMDAADSMKIIDSWNEISNNYATTTEKLAQGQAKAGATARAMGLDFDKIC